MKPRNLFLLVFALAGLACAPPRYTYVPAATTTTTAADLDATTATEAAVGRGRVRLAALGVGSVTAPTGSGIADRRVFFVRMDIENMSADEWIVDEAELRIEMTHRGETVTTYATTPTAARAPIVKVAASSSAKLDLLFELPAGVDEVTSFDLVWTVHAGGRLVQRRTPFERVRSEPPDRAPLSPPPPPPFEMPRPPWAPEGSWR